MAVAAIFPLCFPVLAADQGYRLFLSPSQRITALLFLPHDLRFCLATAWQRGDTFQCSSRRGPQPVFQASFALKLVGSWFRTPGVIVGKDCPCRLKKPLCPAS